MIKTTLYRVCQEHLDEASNAMRQHATAMSALLHVAQADSTTSQEQLQKYRAGVRASFKGAHAAWDAYHQHLAEHGLLSD